MSSKEPDNGGGLSLQTLVIASLSSLAAALVVHKVWQGGAILGAAITPVIVALVSEGLRKPAQVVTARTGRNAVNPPPVVAPERDDTFGIWEEQRKQASPRRRLHIGLAVATGLVAFVIAGFFLTGAELVLGGASKNDRFRVLPGKQEKRADRDRDRDAPASTEPDQANPVPEEDEEEEAPPTVTVTAPPEEEEEAPPPAETLPPEETAPAPEPPATTPSP